MRCRVVQKWLRSMAPETRCVVYTCPLSAFDEVYPPSGQNWLSYSLDVWTLAATTRQHIAAAGAAGAGPALEALRDVEWFPAVPKFVIWTKFDLFKQKLLAAPNAAATNPSPLTSWDANYRYEPPAHSASASAAVLSLTTDTDTITDTTTLTTDTRPMDAATHALAHIQRRHQQFVTCSGPVTYVLCDPFNAAHMRQLWTLIASAAAASTISIAPSATK
jgi:hypothetical protein